MNRKNGKGGKRPRVEVVFDPDARKEYLTGFHKRKQARRRFGLAMQEIKDRKQRLEERKERREVQRERREELGMQEDLSAFDMKAKAREEAKSKANDEVTVDFEDRHTQSMFGETVTVTTVAGVPDSDGEHEAESELLEKELLEEKKRLRAERLARGRVAQGTCGGGIHTRFAGNGEGALHERWSLSAVSKRLAANMPAKSRKGSNKRSNDATKGDKGRKGGKGKRAGRRGTPGGGALLDKARGSMPRAELGKSKRKKKG